MPNMKSAKKRVLTSAKKCESNNVKAASLKTAVKGLEKEIKNGTKENAQTKLTNAIKKIDKAAKKNIIHKNKAARLKSRLTKKANNME